MLNTCVKSTVILNEAFSIPVEDILLESRLLDPFIVDAEAFIPHASNPHNTIKLAEWI